MMIPTPHIEAKIDQIAETVLMPGDPLRAKFIAENFLTNIECYNNVRGMLGYTGIYKDKKVSVQGSGMGIPSIGIYSYELYKFYNVKNIIRIGSAGALSDDLNLKDIVIGMTASTDSNFATQFGVCANISPVASYDLLEKAVYYTRKKNLKFKVGNIFSSDVFYNYDQTFAKKLKDIGILAVEMEAAGLYLNAARLNKNALCIATISDCIFTDELMSAEERQNSFTDMMEIALNVAVEI